MKQDENKIISMLCTHSIIAILIQFTVIINGAVQCVTVIFVPTRPEPAACCSLHFYVHLLKLWFVMSLHWIAWIHIIVSASSAFNGLCSKSVEGKAIYRLFTKTLLACRSSCRITSWHQCRISAVYLVIIEIKSLKRVLLTRRVAFWSALHSVCLWVFFDDFPINPCFQKPEPCEIEVWNLPKYALGGMTKGILVLTV